MSGVKTARFMLLASLCTFGFGGIGPSTIIVTSCQAMQAPHNNNNINFNEFMTYVQSNTNDQALLNTPTGQSQQAIIMNLFVQFGSRISKQNKAQFFGEIDRLASARSILGRQAKVLKDYLEAKLASFGHVPSSSSNLLQWTQVIARTVNTYFKQPYTDTKYADPRDVFDCRDGRVVNRPNHGLGHGVRQGIYAVDIVEALNSSTFNFQDDKALKLQRWVRNKMAQDPHFREKVEFASAFQRTGRKSEKDGGKKYVEYMEQDVENFKAEVVPYSVPGGMFENDVDTYASALGPNDPINEDAKYLSKIFIAAHRLDLRRLTYDSTTGSFQEDMCEELFDSGSYHHDEKKFIDTLWGRAGEYLRATGDQDRDPFVKGHRFRDPQIFCDLAYHPLKMAQVLIDTRQNTKYKF